MSGNYGTIMSILFTIFALILALVHHESIVRAVPVLVQLLLARMRLLTALVQLLTAFVQLLTTLVRR